MDIHQNLYKNIKVPKSLTKRRDIQKENRLNRRQKDFQQRRNISLSPETSQSNIQQKTIDPETIGLAVPNDSALRRQREYLARLRGWKKQKMEANKENIYKTKPFIPAGSGTSTNVLCQNSKQKPIKSDVVKNRQSIYALRKTTAGVSCSNGNQPKSEIPTTNKSTSKNVTRLEGPSTSVTKNMKKAPDHNKLKAKIEQPAKKQEDNTMKNQFKKNMHTLPAKLIPKAQLVEQKSVVTQNKPNLKRITTKEGTNKSVKSKLGTTMKAKKETINQHQKSNLSKISKAQLNCIANEVMGTSTGTKQNSYEICVTSNRFKRSKNNITCSNNNKSIQNGPRQKQVEQKCKFIRYSLAFSEENENKNAFNKSNKENDSDKLTIKNSRGGVVMENKSTPKKSITENRKNECTSTDSNPIANNLDGVRLYRQQLQKETERLQNLCETWELYEQDNQTFLEERSGDDMIHATLGQTRLFINKKFKQFSQLIDRCEKNIHNSIEGSGSSVPLDDDGSESTKPITLRDLDGFWHSMIELQLADLEKRFKNLNRWKANDWKDPDEVVQSERPTVKNAGKVSKGNKMKNSNRTKLSTSSSTAAAFIAMMRKAQVEKLQQEQQKQHNEDDTDVIVTSSKSNKRNNPSSCTVTLSTQFQQQQLPVQKLNFIRYSLAKEDENTENNDVENEKVNELFQNSDKENDSDKPTARNNEKETPMDNKSPPIKSDVVQLLTYLSPCVTVTRGTFNSKTEECERQRIITDINSVPNNLDGVRFYRQQLQKETERLQNLCETWELYKEDNQTFLKEIDDDMIHATLGQTRLLINKKFKQFSKLIDHCEKNIYNSIESSGSSVPLDDDGSKNTKPKTLRDLGCCWLSMIKSQLDDLEKRFKNLNRWKANDWKNPDEVVQSERPTVKNAGKACKGNKIKSSSRTKLSTSSSTAAAFIDSDKLTIKNSREGVVMENKSTPKKSITEDRKNECTSTDSNPMANNLDGVRFYRQQLQKETERLQNLCETWELYEQDNQTFLEERSGDDMIHATLGQTRLFINKKFKQFSQLIDRCEKNIHNSIEGSGSSVPLDDDGSESTKPITLRDLDGFWHSMIELQLADLEKRFKNLNRWKANDWKDPDEVVQSERPTVKNAGKVSKGNKMKNSNRTKLSTSSSTAAAFIAMMRKAQVEKLQQEQQKQHNEDDTDVIVTSYKSNRRNNPSSFTVTSSTQFQLQQHPVQKPNFIRYSLAKEDENTENNDVENEKVNELFQNSDKDNDSDTPILRNNEKETPLDDKSTPVKNAVTQPLTYLSPSVTVARGKVTPETEERERQRIITDINSMTINLDGVRFYRQQLQTKNERLQNLCETWELYKQHNQTFLEEIGDDMIHATLSQTRLFINKKLKQFSKLIDHCEKNIYNSIESSGSSVPLDDNGGKNTKPVKLRDLEDFWWSMIKSKLDDLEKRFENLNLWKANNWKDPDEVVQSERPTVKSAGKARKGNKMKNSSRMKVSTSSSTAAAFIAQVRKNRTQKQCDDDGCDVTPSQDNARKDSRFTITPLSSSKQQQWPRIRHSAVVRDRKYMSPTATRLSLRGPKPSPRPPSFLLKPAFLQQDLNLNLSSAIQKLNKSLETLNAAANNSSGKDKGSPKKKELVRTPPAELPSAHKSILKTPGTAKSKLKNVSFDCKLRVKPHKFIFTDEGDSVSSASTYEEDMENSNNTQEVQSLSNEKELARPSHDNT